MLFKIFTICAPFYSEIVYFVSEFVLLAQLRRLALTHGGCLSASVPAQPPPSARLFSNICSNKFNLMNGSCRLSGLNDEEDEVIGHDGDGTTMSY